MGDARIGNAGYDSNARWKDLSNSLKKVTNEKGVINLMNKDTAKTFKAMVDLTAKKLGLHTEPDNIANNITYFLVKESQHKDTEMFKTKHGTELVDINKLDKLLNNIGKPSTANDKLIRFIDDQSTKKFSEAVRITSKQNPSQKEIDNITIQISDLARLKALAEGKDPDKNSVNRKKLTSE